MFTFTFFTALIVPPFASLARTSVVPSGSSLGFFGNDTMQALRSESRAEGWEFASIGRQWGSLSSCPTSCAMYPGWTSGGRMVWLWILIFSVVGPFFLAVVQKRFFWTVNNHVPRVLEFAFSPCSFSLMPGGAVTLRSPRWFWDATVRLYFVWYCVFPSYFYGYTFSWSTWPCTF